MGDTEETPAQKSARIRRQKREAKINANAQERLDKITKLSGRTPESSQSLCSRIWSDANSSIVRNEAPSPLSGTATPPAGMASTQSPAPPPPMAASNTQTLSPEQARLQEEYLRALMRGPGPQADGQGQAQNASTQDDPMMQMLNSMMSGMGGAGDPNNPDAMPFNPDELAKQSGLPSWATSMMFGSQKAPPTPAEERSLRQWKVVHVIVAVLSGVYTLFIMDKSLQTYGAEPPAPPTFQNPFVVFLMAQLALQSARILTAGQTGKRGPGLYYQMLKEFAGDGAIIVFMVGLATWWKSNT
jgi:GET complex subunit GET2